MHNAAPLAIFWCSMPRRLRAGAVGLTRRCCRGSAAAAGLLFAYAAIWTASATIWNLGIPIHSDMAEAFALSREPAIGYFKFAPLINWVTAAWFLAMPITPWAFYGLAYLNAALGMALVNLAASFVVDPRRRLIAVALLGLSPIFTFAPALFNHNTFQLSLWPLVVWTFFASIERANLWWSIAFGVASGLAILGKYYAGLIVLACMLAVLLHPQRRSYLGSTRPYLAATACAVVLALNFFWLFNHDFVSIRLHINQERTVDHPLTVAAHVLSFIGAFVLLALTMVLAFWFCFRPWSAAKAKSVVADWRGNRVIVGCIAFAPVLLPAALLAPAGILLRSPWNDPAFFFVPLALVSAPRLLVTYRATAATVGAVAATTVLVLALSPILAIGNFLTAQPAAVEPVVALARFATDTWRERVGKSLEFVAGSNDAAWSVSFYSPDHPQVFPGYSEFLSQADIDRRWKERGVLGICRAQDSWCSDMFSRSLPGAERVETTLTPTFLGLRRAPETYTLYFQLRGAAQ